jgi:DNA-binding CsgD family transcriptional regulator
MINDQNLTASQFELLCQTHKLIAILTESEQRIAKLTIQGYTSRQIASYLENSPSTIDHHIENITRKARTIYGHNISYRSHIVPRLYCYCFLHNEII